MHTVLLLIKSYQKAFFNLLMKIFNKPREQVIFLHTLVHLHRIPENEKHGNDELN